MSDSDWDCDGGEDDYEEEKCLEPETLSSTACLQQGLRIVSAREAGVSENGFLDSKECWGRLV
jgi:hypothetical protein